jgi:hypothetical protein
MGRATFSGRLEEPNFLPHFSAVIRSPTLKILALSSSVVIAMEIASEGASVQHLEKARKYKDQSFTSDRTRVETTHEFPTRSK